MSAASDERERRIKVAVWACAYEFYNESFVSDAKYDTECGRINTSQSTGDAALDQWFKDSFDPSTGMWVHSHPGLDRLKEIVEGILPMRI